VTDSTARRPAAPGTPLRPRQGSWGRRPGPAAG